MTSYSIRPSRNGFSSSSSLGIDETQKYMYLNSSDATNYRVSSPVDDSSSDGSSTWSATVNLSKLCIGSGILALPYAAQKGGLLFTPVIIGVIAYWNMIACEQIIECKNLSQQMNYTIPNEVNSTYSRIAYCALGWPGVRITDICIVVTLLGVCVTYLITFSSMLEEIPGIPFSASQLIAFSVLIVYPMSCYTDVSKLTSFSLLGLVCLIGGVVSIVCFGLYLFGEDVILTGNIDLPLFPQSITDFSTFVGIVTFGFGLPSLAFPVEESMARPSEFYIAARWAVIFVWIVYFCMADGVSILFVHDDRGIASNILKNLPTYSFLGNVVRIAMAFVCLLTFPLTFIPPAQLAEQALVQYLDRIAGHPYARNMQYNGWLSFFSVSPMEDNGLADDSNPNYMSTSNISDNEELLRPTPTPFLVYIIRLILVLLCAYSSFIVPCFGLVVSLLGCFTVSVLSFVLPPYLSLILITGPAYAKHPDLSEVKFNHMRDNAMTAIGVVVCVTTTLIVAFQCSEALNSDQC